MRALLVSIVVLAGCSSPGPCPDGDCDPDPTGCETADDCGGAACINHDCLETPGTGVDLLFVVDDSANMVEHQLALGAAFPGFLAALVEAHGGPPDLHVAVVSTSLGAGGFNIPTCPGSGDNGAFRLGMSGCPQVSGTFLSDVSDGAGGREVNYTGSLAEAFACASSLGTTGCGFEQPLESMRRALDSSNPGNAGFLREGAALAVVILTDEDDCSAEDPSMFDPTQDAIDGALGPLHSFRCFEFGVACDPDEPRATGAKSGCAPREDSAYMHGIRDYVDFLTTLRPPSLLSITVIAGPATPVTVQPDPEMGNPTLAPSCESANGAAMPAVRLAGLAGALPDTGSFAPICAPYAAPLAELAADIAAMIE